MPVVARVRSAVVIDDHPCLLDVIVEMLQHQGWSVRGFTSVEDALPYVRSALPDVVLTDINVGALSGAALARELRLDPATADLVIVAMTGSVEPTARMASLFDEVLLKPIELARLSDTLKSTMDRCRL